MSIPLEARIVDLVNLIIAKGSNFLLTVLLFTLISHGMDAHAFGEFGYWWSIAIMIGGVLLGGLSSALVRVTAVHGSMRHLAVPLRHAGLGLLVLVVVWSVALLAFPQYASLLLLLAAVGLFGIVVQAQTAVLSLLRAIEATRANMIASVLIVVCVPLSLYLALGAERGLSRVFGLLAAAFALGTLAALVTSRRKLGYLLAPGSTSGASVATFFANASSFTAINVFSYAIVNVDFTLFRMIGTPAEFAVMATGKVFFERFVVPALMVFAGAVSLRVLRHPHAAGGPEARLDVRLGPRAWYGAFAMVVVLVFAYWIFAHKIRGDVTTIPLPWVVCASIGYLLYAINGILLDVMVVQRPLITVVWHVAGFIVLGGVMQAFAIYSLGVPGWALAWLLFNVVVAVVLARNGLRFRRPVGQGLSETDDLKLENQ